MDQRRQEIIHHNPTGKIRDMHYRFFEGTCKRQNLACNADSVDTLEDREIYALAYLLHDEFRGLISLPVVSQLYTNGGDVVSGELSKVKALLQKGTVGPREVIPFIKAAVTRKSDIGFWSEVLNILEEGFPSPSIQQTPWIPSADNFSNSAQYKKYLNTVIEEEIGSLHLGLPNFYGTFFGVMSADLAAVSKLVFESCSTGNSPLYDKQQCVWLCPKDIVGSSWFPTTVKRLLNLAHEFWPDDAPLRSIARPIKQLEGLINEQKLDVGMIDDSKAEDYFKYPWSRVLILGQLRNNADSDGNPRAWLDFGRYAKEVISAHDGRRFVHGFTLFGNLMRFWMFDRIGGIASSSFDIHANGVRFVYTILAMHLMDDQQLGLDPTIQTADGKRFIQIQRNRKTERLILDKVITRSHHLSGRGTTCWKAHLESKPKVPLVIKDSWMLEHARDEGQLLREVTKRGVTNVARYYHHEIVHVSGKKDDIQKNVRKRLDGTEAEDYSSSWHSRIDPWENRLHRRIITRDFGKPIHEALTPKRLLVALENCIKGHESLWKVGFIHRDISIDNLMISESSSRAFLIDLELAIEEKLCEASEESSQTGTRPFMAISTLSGAKHNFMHDVESFFWVLFLICILYDGYRGDFRRVAEFDSWNTQSPTELAVAKLGIISMEEEFLDLTKKNFTPRYQCLIPCVNKLRRVVFPGDAPSMTKRPKIYDEIYQVLQSAREDFKE